MHFIECRSVTDSVGSHSDLSVHTIQAGSTTGSGMTRPHMDVVCVLDICQSGNLNHRKKALEEVKQACMQIGAKLNHIQVRGDLLHTQTHKKRILFFVLV